MSRIQNIAVIAHDNRKKDMLSWVVRHRQRLEGCTLMATGTTGRLIAEETGLPVIRYASGPLGGDQQIGARISEGGVDMLIFFWDPLEPMPHDPDVKALLRLATLWNIPTATNEVTADMLLTSPLFEQYEPKRPDFSSYTERKI
ncbi:methylglyoxal synthase [Hahella sp. SMD15-11]|uniref:Methylglyoxal synthase n=1 Tax=Thermohahella caldifontis TaxID=3142973 RepID=A0AB39UYR5_9GAMM